MALYIHCGYSRVAVRELVTQNSTANRQHRLSEQLITEYNTLFEGYPNMQLEGKTEYILKKCKELCSNFSQRWYPKEMAQTYMSTFAREMWVKLSCSQKLQHSRRDCKACPIIFPELTSCFPCKKRPLRGN